MAYINISSEVISPNCFRNNQTVTNVDLSNVSFTNANASSAFRNCTNLQSVTNLPNNCTNLTDLFRGCVNLTTIGKLPDGPTNMSGYSSSSNFYVYGFDTNRSSGQPIYTTVSPNIDISSYLMQHDTSDNAWFSRDDTHVIQVINDTSFIFINDYQQYLATRNSALDQKIQSEYSCNYDFHSPFSNCFSLLESPQLPNTLIKADYLFQDCTNLTTVSNLPNSIQSMRYTFHNCINLQNIVSLPNNIRFLYDTFSGCQKLTNVPTIPNSVIDMNGAFSKCTSLINAPTIPNNVKSIQASFVDCYNLVNAPNFPSRLENMDATFRWCYNLANVSSIPDSVTNMWKSFSDCRNLVKAPTIGTGVQYMDGTFSGCKSLTGNISIESPVVNVATNCFNSTSLTKNVYIPFAYDNGVASSTYNAFTNAGYDTVGTTNGVYLKDFETQFKLYFVGDATQWEFTNDYLLTYQGNKIFSISDVIVPANSYFLISTSDWEHGYRAFTETILSTGDSEFTDTINGTEAFKTGDSAVVIGELRLNRKTGYLQFLNVVNYTEPTTKVNVENFNYTAKAGKVTLTRYTGSQSNVVLPELEDK